MRGDLPLNNNLENIINHIGTAFKGKKERDKVATQQSGEVE